MQESGAPPRFTILLPVVRPPTMLPYAIETVLAQTLTAFELFIICDGAPEQTVVCAQSFAARDPRVRVFAFAKGEAAGQAHRHAALEQAKGRYIAHIADDDLWFPNHLVEMGKLLDKVDFGNVLNVYANVDGSFRILPSDLTRRKLRDRILNETFNVLGDTVTGYRLDAYRRLPEGWAPPKEPPFNPDVRMWRKFFSRDDITFGTRTAVTALIFESEKRHHMSIEARAQEIRDWFNRISIPAEREEIIAEIWRSFVVDFMDVDDYCGARLAEVCILQGQVRALAASLEHRLKVGSTVDFTEHGTSFLYTVSGWSAPEPDHRWTEGNEAIIRVQLESSPAGDVHDVRVLRLRAFSFDDPQRAVVLVNGKRAAELTVDDCCRNYDVEIDLSNHTAGTVIDIALQLPDAHPPSRTRLSSDSRQLGIALISMTFLPSPAIASSGRPAT